MKACFMIALLVVIGLMSAFSPADAAGKPNIVFILMDNLGYGEVGVYGGGALRGAPTPRIDKLASHGLRLTNMNMEVQCTPSRSSIMTGRFAIRSGTYAVTFGGGDSKDGLVPWEITIAESLSAAGYATALFGKWHLGNRNGRFPNDQGFDEWWGIPRTSDEALWPSDPGYDPNIVSPEMIMRGSKHYPSVPVRVYDLEQRALIDDNITSHSVAYIKRQAKAGKPFFLFVSYTQPHFPTIPNPAWKGKTGNGDWADVLAEMDHNVGRLLDTVNRLKIQDNTIVIFTSDNGAEGMKPYDGWAGPWRGTYFTALEGGLRVPFVIHWPGKIAGGRVSNEIVHGVDMFATLASLAGASVPKDRPIDSRDQSDFFTDKNKKSAREGFPIWNADLLMGVKWCHWKAAYYRQNLMIDPPEKLYVPAVFNLFTDPQEEKGALETWVVKPANEEVDFFEWSLWKCPLIPMGTDDNYTNPTTCIPPFFPAYLPPECGSSG
jgi:arylsulfatase A-like enzyme